MVLSELQRERGGRRKLRADDAEAPGDVAEPAGSNSGASELRMNSPPPDGSPAAPPSSLPVHMSNGAQCYVQSPRFEDAGAPAATSPFRKRQTILSGCAPLVNASVLKNFKFYQEMDPVVQEKLPHISQRLHYPAGTVLFRQGDPAGNCYVVISGEVGIYVMSDSDMEDDSRPRRKHRTFTTELALKSARDVQASGGNSPSSVAQEESVAARRKSRSTSLGTGLELLSAQLPDDLTRSEPEATAEGYSVYTDATDHGLQVTTLGAGRLFGELAMLHDQARFATAKCLEDTEFLVIKKRDFDRVCKEEMKRVAEDTCDFLNHHVPGMAEVPAGRGKPPHSYFFRKASFQKGHRFLKQGAVADEALFVVYKGSVDFSRQESSCEVGGSSPSAARPRSTSGALSGASRRPGSRGCSPARSRLQSRSCAALSKSLPLGPPGPPAVASGKSSHRVVGSLLSGGVFGPSPVIGTSEPFTVTASSMTTEVFILPAEHSQKLPAKLREIIRDYLAGHTTFRLERLQGQRNLTEQQHRTKEVMRWRLPGAGGGPITPEDVLRLKGKLHTSDSMAELLQEKGQQPAMEKMLKSRERAPEQLSGAADRSGVNAWKDSGAVGPRVQRSSQPASTTACWSRLRSGVVQTPGLPKTQSLHLSLCGAKPHGKREAQAWGTKYAGASALVGKVGLQDAASGRSPSSRASSTVSSRPGSAGIGQQQRLAPSWTYPGPARSAGRCGHAPLVQAQKSAGRPLSAPTGSRPVVRSASVLVA